MTRSIASFFWTSVYRLRFSLSAFDCRALAFLSQGLPALLTMLVYVRRASH